MSEAAVSAPPRENAAVMDAGRFGVVIACVTGVVIVLAPLPFGSQAPWCEAALAAVAALLTALWLIGALRAGSLVWSRSAVWPVLLAWLGLVALQCIPMPAGLVAVLSPDAAFTHQSAAPGAARGTITLSVAPHATEAAFFRLLALAAVFLVTAQALTRRAHVVIVLAAVAVAAGVELAFGGYRLATDPGRVLWNAPALVSRTLAGTFLDAGHLAALLAAALGVVMGLWMAVSGTRRGGLLRLVLVAAGVTFGLGIALSRSHAGLLAGLVTVFVFLLTIGFAARLRLRTLGLFAAIALVLCVGQFIALELVLAWLDQTAPTSVRAIEWADRVDLHRSAWTLLATFPLVGSGLDSFGAVFPRFQSGRFGDRLAEHPHNDWMALACESGVVGVLLVAALIVLIVVPALRRGLGRTDPGARWLTAGAMAGAMALLAQSAFDAALLRVPAFGVIFAALLGAGFAAARMPGVDSAAPAPVRRVPLGPPTLRFGLALLVPVALVLAALTPVRRGVADVIVNRGLAAWGEPTDRHHFLPLPTPPGAAEDWLERARRLDPRNPRLARLSARALERKIEAAVTARANRYAAAHLASLGTTGADPSALAAALRPQVEREVLADHAADAVALRAALDRAVRLAPTSAPDRLARARFLLAAGQSRVHREAAGRDASAAMTLAPARPTVLYRAGLVLVDLAGSPGSSGSPGGHDGTRGGDGGAVAAPGRMAIAAGGFRRALAARPAIAEDVYDLLLDASGSPRALFAATPATAPAYARLVDRLITERAWPEALTALDGLDRLTTRAALASRADARPMSPVGLPRPGSFTDRRRALVYERLGDWRRRARAVERYRVRMAAALVPYVAEADRHAEEGRRLDALLAYRAALGLDRAHAGALLGLARLAQDAPDVRRIVPSPLALLERLVRSAADPTRSQLAEAEARARREATRDPAHRPRARRIASAARRRATRPRPAPGSPRRVAEAYGSGPAASVVRAPGFVPVGVDFGGVVTLVGFRLVPPSGGGGPERLVTVWEGRFEPPADARLVVEVLGVKDLPRGRTTRPLRGADGDAIRGGKPFVCAIDLPTSGGAGLRVAVHARGGDPEGPRPLGTDVDEPWLLLRSRSVE